MRLLHTTELRFQEFFDDQVPEYAILSHRWGEEEVSYQDFLANRGNDGAGYAKIRAFCNVAATDSESYQRKSLRGSRGPCPFKWVWIDTCCIDKSSSAELSEAINSMYEWYADSVVCYAYLSDVMLEFDRSRTINALERSEWFRRG